MVETMPQRLVAAIMLITLATVDLVLLPALPPQVTLKLTLFEAMVVAIGLLAKDYYYLS